MKMRIHRDDDIERVRQEPDDDVAAQRLAGAKDGVLTQVRDVGRRKHDTLRARPSQRIGAEQNLDQFGVRIVQRPVDDGAGRDIAHPREGFAILEPMNGDFRRSALHRTAEPRCGAAQIFGECVQADHGDAPIETPLSSSMAALASANSDGSSACSR